MGVEGDRGQRCGVLFLGCFVCVEREAGGYTQVLSRQCFDNLTHASYQWHLHINPFAAMMPLQKDE